MATAESQLLQRALGRQQRDAAAEDSGHDADAIGGDEAALAERGCEFAAADDPGALRALRFDLRRDMLGRGRGEGDVGVAALGIAPLAGEYPAGLARIRLGRVIENVLIGRAAH